MLDFIIYFIGVIVTVPIITTYAIYFISVKIHGYKWRALHTAVNWTTLLYIIADITLLQIIFGNSFFGSILVLLIGIVAIITIAQWKIYTEVVVGKVFKVFWRFCFLLFSIFYCILVLTGIFQRIFY